MSTQSLDLNQHAAQFYPSYVNPNPALSLEQFRLIHNSWQLVKEGQFFAFRAQTLIDDPLSFWGVQFYETLFELAPALKPMFKNKVKQSQMLTGMIDAVLGFLPGNLNSLAGEEKTALDPALIPILIDLAKRHVSYHVKTEHYETVGLALVANLEKTLGSDFGAQTKAAWLELWSLICNVMIPAHVNQAQKLDLDA